MTAYNDLRSNSSAEKLKEYRQSLVSGQSRGNLIGGNLPSAMDVMIKAETVNADDSVKEIAKLFIKSGRSNDPGFVFDRNGTERVLRTIEAGGKIKFFDDFLNLYAFSKEETSNLWRDSTDTIKKRSIARNIEDLVKKTEVNYRTHGDRLHYLVVGRVVVKQSGETKNYPLFLFSCTDLNRRNLSAEVESTGFLNFWLDKNILEDEVSRKIKGFEISVDDSFASKINDIAQLISTIQPSMYDSVEFDPTYSSVCVVTGFEPEFIDPVWGKILEI